MQAMSTKHYILLSCVVSLAAGVSLGILTTKRALSPRPTEEFDNNQDNKPDAIFYYKHGIVTRAEHDRNFDGKWDYYEQYDNGILESGNADDDFDGKIDGWTTYTNRNVHNVKQDTNGNGIPDVTHEFAFGIVNRSVWQP